MTGLDEEEHVMQLQLQTDPRSQRDVMNDRRDLLYSKTGTGAESTRMLAQVYI